MNRDAAQGFTLIEVIVSMLILGTLAMSLFNIQGQNLLFVENIPTAWKHINFAQEFMVEKPLRDQIIPTVGFVPWKNETERTYKLDVQSVPGLRVVTLTTRIDNTTMDWTWSGWTLQ